MTDFEYNILSLLRSHKFEEGAKSAIREKYPFSHAASLTVDSIVLNPEEIQGLIEGAD